VGGALLLRRLQNTDITAGAIKAGGGAGTLNMKG